MRGPLLLAVAAIGACGRFDFGVLADGGSSDALRSDALDAPADARPSFGAVQWNVTTTSATAPSLSVSLPFPPTVGDTIVVYAAVLAATEPQFPIPIDTAGTVFDEVFMVQSGGTGSCGAGALATAMFYGRVTTSVTTDVITVTPDTSGAISVGAIEYAGLSGSPDQLGGGLTPAKTSPFTFFANTVGPTTSSPEILVAFGVTCSGSSNQSVTWQTNPSFGLRGAVTNGNLPVTAADEIISAQAFYSDFFIVTYPGADAPAIGMIASFR